MARRQRGAHLDPKLFDKGSTVCIRDSRLMGFRTVRGLLLRRMDLFLVGGGDGGAGSGLGFDDGLDKREQHGDNNRSLERLAKYLKGVGRRKGGLAENGTHDEEYSHLVEGIVSRETRGEGRTPIR